MDSERFDSWTRSLARRGSRRKLVGALAGSVVLSLAGRRAVGAQVGEPGGMCGGVAGFPCLPGYTCVDVVGDGCDPMAGGMDCAGVCVLEDVNPCASMLCLEGTNCCPQCGGVCVPANVPCSEELCTPQACNQATCGPGEYCCNESCSRCVPLGQGCTREYCPQTPPLGEPCGSTTCSPGEYCCNPSCGICAAIGDSCTEQFCQRDEPVGVPCGPTVCPEGQVCCNESCGICTPPDGACIALYCGPTPFEQL
jgi:hypothetical protein